MTTPPDAGDDAPDLALTAADVVALVAQQIEVSGARPVLTDASRPVAERAAEELLDSLNGDPATPPERANGAEHDSD
ncbi:hypothetical protein [Cryptosporangium japonicum]|uniref:Uncharacterized protein n=1 Tax=Cryptosporangium japonicum TaxID=80872 RepID=A0ABN0V8P6_9ACTN